jgi:hypothetical protein
MRRVFRRHRRQIAAVTIMAERPHELGR